MGWKISQRETDDATLMCQLQKADRRLCSRNTGNEAQVFASLYQELDSDFNNNNSHAG